jgi:hypothetical protein
MKTRTSIFSILGLLFFAGPLFASTIINNNSDYRLIGTVYDEITSLTGTTSSIIVDLGSGPQSTGIINYALDPSGTSYIDFNYDSSTATEHLALLLTFQLQQDMGLAPIPIVIDESGPITEVLLIDWIIPINPNLGTLSSNFSGTITPPGGSSQNTSGSLSGETDADVVDPFAVFQIRSELTGGGTVQSGPFSGFSYDNFNIKIKVNVNSNNNVVPEPSSMFLFPLGLILLRFANVRSRFRKASV